MTARAIAATFAQVDVSDPEALIKTATQQVLNEARQGAIRQGDTQSVIGLMDRVITFCRAMSISDARRNW